MRDPNAGDCVKDAAAFDTRAVIKEEFAFAVSRQSAPGKSGNNSDALSPLLASYLDALSPAAGCDPQTVLAALDGLCTTVAFAHRTRNNTADRQSS